MLEPDASIDTRLTNGLLVHEDQVESGGFIVRDGRIAVDDDPTAEAWRTVDASGFYVFPALLQPGLPTGDEARALASTGAGTAVVTATAESVSQLARELASIAERAVMDYVVVWRVPPDASSADLCAARELGIAAFERRERGPGIDAMMTWRHPLAAGPQPHGTDVLPPPRVILTTTDPEQAKAVAQQARPGVFVELPTTELRDDARDWSTIAALEGAVCVTGDSRLLHKLFEFAVRGNGMQVSQIARLTSTNVAAAYGIDTCKRGLAVGSDADFVVFDATAHNADLPGRAVFSMLRGEILLYNDALHTAPGSGRRLPR